MSIFDLPKLCTGRQNEKTCQQNLEDLQYNKCFEVVQSIFLQFSDMQTLQMYKDIQILKSPKQARSQMQKRQAPTESKKIHTRQAKTQNYRSVMLGSLIQAQFIPILN